MASDLGPSTRRQPRDADTHHSPDERVLAVLRRYAAGEISAREAAYELGPEATEHDVYVGTLNAGLTIPSPPREVVDAEVEALRRLFGGRPAAGRRP